MRYVLNTLGNILLALGLFLVLALTIAPSSLGISINTIISSSMEPALMAGGVILLEGVSAPEVALEDIICFTTEDSDVPVCHRVIRINEGEEGRTFNTKGDALEEEDRWTVRSEDLIGRVTFHIAGVGYLSGWVRSELGFYSLIVLPAVLVGLLEAVRIFRPARARVRRAEERRKTFLTPANNILQIGFVVMAMLWLTVVGNTQERAYHSFEILREGTEQLPEVRNRIIKNEGRLPLVICLHATDDQVSFSSDYFWLPPGEERLISMTGGDASTVVTTRGFLPTLPPTWLYSMYQTSIPLSAIIAAMFPLAPFLIAAWFIFGGVYSPREDHRERARQMKGRLI